jgi:hypothetical protein
MSSPGKTGHLTVDKTFFTGNRNNNLETVFLYIVGAYRNTPLHKKSNHMILQNSCFVINLIPR